MKRTPAKEFRDLIVWQRAHGLVLFIYALSRIFPDFERYGLTSQIRGAATSVPANIAEGFKKRTAAEKIRYLSIDQSSLEECRYFLILIADLGYADTKDAMDKLEEVSRILEAYMRGTKRNFSRFFYLVLGTGYYCPTHPLLCHLKIISNIFFTPGVSFFLL